MDRNIRLVWNLSIRYHINGPFFVRSFVISCSEILYKNIAYNYLIRIITINFEITSCLDHFDQITWAKNGPFSISVVLYQTMYIDTVCLRAFAIHVALLRILTLAMLNKLRCHTLVPIIGQSDYLYKFTYLMTNSADPDLDVNCLQRQGISRFSRTRVNSADDKLMIFFPENRIRHFMQICLRKNKKNISECWLLNPNALRNTKSLDQTAQIISICCKVSFHLWGPESLDNFNNKLLVCKYLKTI